MDPRSETHLVGVHPDLVQVVRRAAEIVTELDPLTGFVVTEGLRSQLRQEQLVRAGASRTMHSRHLTGHAVDMAATVGGEVRWELNLYYRLARAMRRAALEAGVALRWGGCWEILATLKDDEAALGNAVGAYAQRTRQAGGRPLIDGPHFELSSATYP